MFQINRRAKTFRGLLKFTQTFPTGASNVSADVYSSQIMFVTGYVTLKYGLYSSAGYTFVSKNLPDNFVYFIILLSDIPFYLKNIRRSS